LGSGFGRVRLQRVDLNIEFCLVRLHGLAGIQMTSTAPYLGLLEFSAETLGTIFCGFLRLYG
jgi:hypothetical protein